MCPIKPEMIIQSLSADDHLSLRRSKRCEVFGEVSALLSRVPLPPPDSAENLKPSEKLCEFCR